MLRRIAIVALLKLETRGFATGKFIFTVVRSNQNCTLCVPMFSLHTLTQHSVYNIWAARNLTSSLYFRSLLKLRSVESFVHKPFGLCLCFQSHREKELAKVYHAARHVINIISRNVRRLWLLYLHGACALSLAAAWNCRGMCRSKSGRGAISGQDRPDTLDISSSS